MGQRRNHPKTNSRAAEGGRRARRDDAGCAKACPTAKKADTRRGARRRVRRGRREGRSGEAREADAGSGARRGVRGDFGTVFAEK